MAHNTYQAVTNKIAKIEKDFDEPITKVVKDFLADPDLLMPDISRKLGIGGHTLKTIMKRLDIKGRGSGSGKKSKDHIQKISKANTGRKKSKEHIEAIVKARYESGSFRGWYIDKRGYKWLRIEGKYVSEHRLIMERSLDRKLDPSENVHHIDGDRLNNHIDNLALVSRREHLRIEYLVKTLSPDALNILVKTIQNRQI